MRRYLASLAFLIAALVAAQAQAAAPTCNGQVATIYVEAGLIVGGPDNGLSYLGTLTGTNGPDVIVGTGGADVINAGNGDDTVCALGGDDTVDGNNGADWINGGSGTNSINGGNGNKDVCINGTFTNCEEVTETSTQLIVIVEVRGGPAVPSDFTVRVDGNPGSGYLQAPGVGAPGHVFNVNPGYYITDVARVSGYAMDREDYGNPSDCIANPNIVEGETRTCTITMNYLPPANVGDTLSCAAIEAAESGWYGEYFNYPWSRDDMYHTYGGEGTVAPGDGFAGTLRGEPLVFGDDAYEWYHAGAWGDYFRFARIDDLYFGEQYLPFYGSLVEEVTYLPDADYHFGVHWSAVVTVPAPGTYYFLGRLSDSLYIYVNDQLQQILQFQIPGTQFVRFSGALDLAAGDVIDVYYANRTSGGSSAFMLRFLDPNVTVEPYDDCAP